MRVFTASLGTETNTFSPIPTGLDNFKETMLFRAGEHPDEPSLFTGPLWAARKRAKTSNWQVTEGLCAFAQPAGITTRKVYESLRDELLDDLKKAMPVDMVVLGMHGAMVADGYDDCEGDIIERVRRIVGPKIPIGVELDPHCHTTEKMTKNADALVCFKEYPHTDFIERGEELVEIIANTALGKVRPVISTYDCDMIGTFHTPREPMKSYVDNIKSLEGKNGILSISVGHGFPWADVPDLGTKIIVVTDNRKAEGDALAKKLGEGLKALRGKTTPGFVKMKPAIDRAMAAKSGPIVLADVSDNAGGGAPGDATFMLADLIKRGAKKVALGPIWDPIAVRLCFEGGEGARMKLRIGGKTGEMSGQPIDAEVEVTKLVEHGWQWFGRAKQHLGACAAVRLKGEIDLVLITTRHQGTNPNLFTNLGIDPAKKKIVVVKSAQHFYAGFAPLAKEVIYVAAPGAIGPDLSQFPYTRIKRPMWPLDTMPKSLSKKPAAKKPASKKARRK